MSHEVRWYKRAPEHQVFGVGPLFVTRWYNEVNITLLHDQNEAQRAHAKEHGRLLILAIVDHEGMPKVDNVTQEFRETASRFSAENEEHVHAVGYVIPMDGFVGSIARSVIAGITMVLRQPFPTKAFKAPDEGIAWLAEHAAAKGVTLDSAAALRAIAEVRSV